MERNGDDNDEWPTSPMQALEDYVRAAGSLIANAFQPSSPSSPDLLGGHRRNRNRNEGVKPKYRRSNSVQRLNSYASRALRLGQSAETSGYQYFDPEVLADHKRQWFEGRSTALDYSRYKEPTGLLEHFVIVGLHPDTNLEAFEDALIRRKEWESGMGQRPDIIGSRMQQNRRPPSLPNLEPEILFRYPPGKKLAMQFKDLASFCFPSGVEARVVQRTPSLSDLNEIVYGQEHLNRDDMSFVFYLKVADNATLYGVCLQVQEFVQRAPDISRVSSPVSSVGFSRFLVSAPRCYCVLTRVPFFELHYEMLNSIIMQGRLNRINYFVIELSRTDSSPSMSKSSNDSENTKSPHRISAGDQKEKALAVPTDYQVAADAAILLDSVVTVSSLRCKTSTGSATPRKTSNLGHIRASKKGENCMRHLVNDDCALYESRFNNDGCELLDGRSENLMDSDGCEFSACRSENRLDSDACKLSESCSKNRLDNDGSALSENSPENRLDDDGCVLSEGYSENHLDNDGCEILKCSENRMDNDACEPSERSPENRLVNDGCKLSENGFECEDMLPTVYEYGSTSIVGTLICPEDETLEHAGNSESSSSVRSRLSDDDDYIFCGNAMYAGDEMTLEWAKENKNDLMQIVGNYYSMPLPARGDEIVFHPLEHLQALRFTRLPLSALQPTEEHLNLALQDPRKASQVLLQLAAAEEAAALSRWTIATLCRVLSLEKILSIISGVLLEKQVLVVCPNLGVLSAIVLSLVPIIRPFEWQSFFLPILPERMLDFIDAPVPFIVGVQQELPYSKIKTSNSVHVDLVKDQVKMSNLPVLPRYKELMFKLQPFHAKLSCQRSNAQKHPIYRCNELQAEAATEFLDIMRNHLESLCSDLRSYSITNVLSEVSVLLKESFIESFETRDQPFVKLFVETQLFSVLSDSRL